MKRAGGVFVVLFVMLVSACAVNLNINRYALNSVCIRSNCFGSCYTLLVSEPTVQPGYDTDQIIYTDCPYLLKAYSRNRWVAPPHEMLTSLISQSLRNSCFFRAVVIPPFSGETHYKLETRLMKLQHEFLCRPSRVHVTLHAVVIDTSCHQAIGEKVFDIVVIAPKGNPYSGVLAANKAVKILLEQLTGFVICTIQQHPSLPKPRKYMNTHHDSLTLKNSVLHK